MSVKHSRKSKVSVNNAISSEDESDTDLGLDERDDNLGDIEDINDNSSNDFSDNSVEDTEDKSSDNLETTNNNKSWADAVNKVLSTKSKSKSILSKAKKDKDIDLGKRKSDKLDNDLELVDEDGNVVKRNDNHIDSKKNKKSKTDESHKRNKTKVNKNEWELMARLKPNPNDKERERTLASIATKGVVQLFNAVREQQQSIKNKMNEVGLSETKRDKAMSQFTKTQFLDKLKKKANNNDKNATENKSDTKSSEERKWKVLRDDFMIGAKMKDWDKDTDSDSDD